MPFLEGKKIRKLTKDRSNFQEAQAQAEPKIKKRRNG